MADLMLSKCRLCCTCSLNVAANEFIDQAQHFTNSPWYVRSAWDLQRAQASWNEVTSTSPPDASPRVWALAIPSAEDCESMAELEITNPIHAACVAWRKKRKIIATGFVKSRCGFSALRIYLPSHEIRQRHLNRMTCRALFLTRRIPVL